MNQYVKLNVGGDLFTTTIGTLTSHEGMLKNMFKGNFENKKDSEGYVMIDRDGKTFREILNFLRRGSISLSKSKEELENLWAEADFYQIQPLICLLKARLSVMEERELHFKKLPRSYLVVDKAVVPSLIKGTTKPIIWLEIGDEYRDLPSMREELTNFASLSREYGDIFEFVLSLDKDKKTKCWWFMNPGKDWVPFKSWKSDLPTENPMTKLVAQVLRNAKTKDRPN